jgi:hypothetical protein
MKVVRSDLKGPIRLWISGHSPAILPAWPGTLLVLVLANVGLGFLSAIPGELARLWRDIRTPMRAP